MSAMPQPLRRYAITLAVLWTVMCIAAVLFSQQQNIPLWVGLAVAPAFLVEAAFYLASGLSSMRRYIEDRTTPTRLAIAMTLSAVPSYLIYALGTGVFAWEQLLLLTGLAATASFWYPLAGKKPAADLGFLALMGGVYIAKTFQHIYVDPMPKVTASAIGALMWIRLGMVAVLSLRRMEGIGLSFLPRGTDWRIGVLYYLGFLPVGLGLAVALDFLRPEPQPLSSRTVAAALLTFVVTLWVLALAEELFFRGLLQQFLSKRLRSEWVSIGAASVLFGLTHLWYRSFPNWRFALLAACAGVFYGCAYSQTRSIRASMVTHALVVTTWRVFLS